MINNESLQLVKKKHSYNDILKDKLVDDNVAFILFQLNYKEKYDKLKTLSLKISSKNEKLLEENEKCNEQLNALYNLLNQKDKQITFFQKKYEFLKNINVFRKLRKKIFENITRLRFPSHLIYFFNLWKCISKVKFNQQISNLFTLDNFTFDYVPSKIYSNTLIKFKNEVNKG